MKLFTKRGWPDHQANIRQFERLMAMNNDIRFYQPDVERAPWHVQARVNGTTLNFWPHLLKGNVEGARAVHGYNNLQQLIGDARNADPIELIE